MSGFLDPLKVDLLDGERLWITRQSMNYEVGVTGSGINICIEAGLITDFGSVPQIFHSLISPIGLATRAYVLHDFLYQRQHLSRGMSDYILLEAMKVLGVRPLHRRAVYYGVRLGGWMAWRKHAKENKRKRRLANKK